MLDYEVLKFIWWLLVGVLLLGFSIMDGHDMGVGTLLPFVARKDVERRILLNTIGPHWDGNQVWFITAGGAIFAAWPLVYATAFSGLYLALIAVLFALFFRPVGFDYRSKIADPRWRSTWDWLLFVGGAVPSLVFGVAFGNLFLGLPFRFDDALRSTYEGSGLFELLMPFPLLCGVVSLAMLTFHGGNYLMVRTEGEVFERARRASLIFGGILLLSFIVAGLWVSQMPGFVLVSGALPEASPNPLAKEVVVQAGAWFGNYSRWPLTMLIPAIGIGAAGLGIFAAWRRMALTAFIASALAMLGVIGTAGVSLFPFVMPSALDPRSSLTLWDSTSSHMTMTIMFWVALVMTPIIVAYTGWAYKVMAGKVTAQRIEADHHTAY